MSKLLLQSILKGSCRLAGLLPDGIIFSNELDSHLFAVDRKLLKITKRNDGFSTPLFAMNRRATKGAFPVKSILTAHVVESMCGMHTVLPRACVLASWMETLTIYCGLCTEEIL